MGGRKLKRIPPKHPEGKTDTGGKQAQADATQCVLYSIYRTLNVCEAYAKRDDQDTAYNSSDTL